MKPGLLKGLVIGLPLGLLGWAIIIGALMLLGARW